MLTQPCFAEAPGRLDFMGGVADYSGSLVLQTPIQGRTRVTITPLDSSEFQLESDNEGTFVMNALELKSLFSRPVADWTSILRAFGAPHWAHYVLGSFGLFSKSFDWWPVSCLRFEVASTVPTSMGVSSSAALEVSTLRALQLLTGHLFSGTNLAKTAQRAENEVVGAPCGLMDQLASQHGVPGSLLPILCRPDILRDPVALPIGAIAVGWPSGVKHSVADSPYATARAAAFMGKRILETNLGRPLAHITELPPSVVRSQNLPGQMTGSDFLSIYGETGDSLTQLDPNRTYPVRNGALFPVEENFRCHTAEHLLRTANSTTRETTLAFLGELMYQSHAGYTSIGLGCPETDAMVEATRQLGPESGFYGARVSGGGSGGTVAVLLEATSLPILQRLVETLATPPLIR